MLQSARSRAILATALILIGAALVASLMTGGNGAADLARASDQEVVQRETNATTPPATPGTSDVGSRPPIPTAPFEGSVAVVTGRVVDQDTGQGIAGASVKLQNSDHWAIAPIARSEAEGRFILCKVPFGHYLLTPWWNDELAISGDRVGVTVSTPQPREIVFRARVGYWLSGVLVEAVTRRPIPRVGLSFLPAGSKSYEPLGRTDESGRFKSTKPLPAGPGAITTGDLRDWKRNSPELVLKKLILGSNPYVDIDVVYPHAGVIKGTLLDTSGQPISGQVVSLIDESSALPLIPPHLRDDSEYRTDGRGRFQFEHLPLNVTFTVQAVMDSHGIAALENIRPDPLNLARDLVLRPDASTSIGGILRYGDGAPASDVRVYLLNLREKGEFWAQIGATRRLLRATTDPSGMFQFSGLVPGRFSLRGSLPGRSRRKDDGQTERHFWLAGNLRIEQGRALAVNLRELPLKSIAGTILLDGTPANSPCKIHARIIRPRRESPGNDQSISVFHELHGLEFSSDDHGSFLIRGLPRATYRLTPSMKGAVGEPLDVEAGSSGVLLGLTSATKLTRLEVRAQTPASGNPAVLDSAWLLSGGKIKVLSGHEVKTVLIRPGKYPLFLRCRGFAPMSVPVVVPADGRTTHAVAVTLNRGRRISVTLRESDGVPVTQAMIYLILSRAQTSPAPSQGKRYTDEKGRFVIEHAPLEGGLLLLRIPRRKSQVVPIDSAHMEIVLPPR